MKRRKFEPLPQEEQQALDKAINRHNELCQMITEHIIEHGVYEINGEMIVSQPPLEWGAEYCQNFEENIEKYVKLGRVSCVIGGVTR